MVRSPTVSAALLMAFAVSCVAVDTMIIRVIAEDIHPFQIAFFRALFSMIVLIPWLMGSGLAGLRTRYLPLHILRASLKLLALICFFFAIAGSPLSLVTAIAFATPLVVTTGSMVFLGEPARPVRLIALAVGFSGVLLVVRPGLAPIDAGVQLAIVSAVGLGGVGLLMKFLSMREKPGAVVGLNLVLTVPVALVVCLPVWTMPSAHMWLLLVLQGLLGGLSQLAVSRAMSMSDASILSPIDFLRLPLVVLLAWLIFREGTDIWTVAGGAVIFLSTLGLVMHERRVPLND